ncbi:MAG TPA: hypothetical protein GXX40_04915 [Firmicutes bacterium]|nr:hypothetical protein [Bacillota bacterium]
MRITKSDITHALLVGIASFCVAIALTGTLNRLAFGISQVVSMLVLAAVLLTGIVFDMIGVAAASADEAVFHSLASKKLKGAKRSVWLCRNRAKVASFCNDFVGDLCGTIAGAVGTVVAFRVGAVWGVNLMPVAIATVAGVTIAGKALAKSYGISKANEITRLAGIALEWAASLVGLEGGNDRR